jgi:cytoskeleton protein RodZ
MSTQHRAAGDPAQAQLRSKPDGSIDPAGEAGWFLQRERLRRGLSLHQIAEILDIHESHIEGIEHGDLTRLPPLTDSLSMVGLYGQYLGFDPEPLMLHYADFLPPPQPQPVDPPRASPSPHPKPLSSAKIIPFGRALKLLSSRQAMSIGGSGLAVMLVLGLGFSFLTGGDETAPASDIVAEAPAETLTDPLAHLPLPPLPEESAKIEVTETPLADDVPAVDDSEAAVAEPPAEQAQAETDVLAAFITKQLEGTPAIEAPSPGDEVASIAPPDAKQETGVAGHPRLVLEAKGPVWIRVEDTRGNVVVSRTMRAGDDYEVPERDDLVIISRDGGLIGYSVDGVERGTLGGPGEILVGRSLSIARLLDSKG